MAGTESRREAVLRYGQCSSTQTPKFPTDARSQRQLALPRPRPRVPADAARDNGVGHAH